MSDGEIEEEIEEDYEVYRIDRVNQLNRAFTVIFTEAMQSLKPLKDIEKLRAKIEISKDEKSYDTRIKQWQSAFAFRIELRNYINELNNILVLAGGSNSSKGRNNFTSKSLKSLEGFMKSNDKRKSFEEYMKSCEPKNIISNNEEKLKIWNEAFIFPSKLNEFIKELKTQINDGKEIPEKDFLNQIDKFIESLQIDEDEFLIKETDDIGGEEYKVDFVTIKTLAHNQIKKIVEEIPTSETAPEDFKDQFNKNKENFIEVMKDARRNELEVKAEKKILEKKYDKASIENLGYNLDGAIKTGAAHLKKYPKLMDKIAIAGMVGILALMVLSIACPIGCSPGNLLDDRIDDWIKDNWVIDKISEAVSTVTILENKTLFGQNAELTGMEITTITNPSETSQISNPYREVLESNIMYVLIITIIAPVVAKTLKEKYDINIEEKQISMIIADGIKSTSMYTKEADKLRNHEGKIPRKYQEALRAKAFKSIKKNYSLDKYKELISSVGSQVFDKAIENAVASGKIKKFPLEKKQVEELIKQSIDAAPGIIEWQKLDDKAKITFIDGNIRKLLKNTGINGWSYKALENIFDVETNKRLVGAALIVKDNVLKEINSKNPYLKYTSTAIDAILEREKPK